MPLSQPVNQKAMLTKSQNKPSRVNDVLRRVIGGFSASLIRK